MIMNKILYPGKEKWMKILERPENRGEDLDKVCKAVFDEVKRDRKSTRLNSSHRT